MAEISKLSRLVGGIVRNVDLASNTLVVSDLKVGGASGTSLTKTILDKLILINTAADVDGTFDTRYLGISAKAADADKLDNHDSTYFATADHNHDSAYLGISAKAADSELLDNHDSTYFATSDHNHDLTYLGITAKAADSDKLNGQSASYYAIASDVSTISGKVDNLVTLSGVAANSTSLGTFSGSVIADNQTIKQALQALETYSENSRSLIENFEWQNSVKDRLATPPGSPALGDRYLVIATATGAWEGQENKIAEWNSSSWDFTAPLTGMFVAVDDESDGLYNYGGASWSKKYFEATTASTGLYKDGFDIQLADAAENASGIKVLDGVITLEALGAFDTDDLAEGATNKYFSASAAKSACVADSITDAVTDVAPSQNAVFDALAGKSDTSHNHDLAYLGINAKAADSDKLDNHDSTYFATADHNHDSTYAPLAHDHARILKAMVAGQSFSANTVYAVRMAMNGETDGRVYAATNDASVSDKFHVIGLIYPTASKSAGDSVDVIMLGEIISSVAFTASQDEGKPVFLSTAGAITLTPPSATDTAAVKVGMVSLVGDAGTAKILVSGIQVMGVN